MTKIKDKVFFPVQPHSHSGQVDAINVIININNMIGHKTENETHAPRAMKMSRIDLSTIAI